MILVKLLLLNVIGRIARCICSTTLPDDSLYRNGYYAAYLRNIRAENGEALPGAAADTLAFGATVTPFDDWFGISAGQFNNCCRNESSDVPAGNGSMAGDDKLTGIPFNLYSTMN